MSLHQINMFLMNTSALSGTLSVKAPTPSWAKDELNEEEAKALAEERRDRKTYVSQSQYDEIVAVDPTMADMLVVIHPASLADSFKPQETLK
jgi:hypothetical protein